MESRPVEKIAKVLHTLVNITLICNLIALLMAPGMVYFRFAAENPTTFAALQSTFAYDVDDGLGNLFSIYFSWVWQEPYTAMLSLFLLFSGTCTAVVLWQGRSVLNAILRGDPFSMENAVALKRAAVCGFLISGAALVRLVFSICYYASARPLTTYNALFVPIFAMAGLLCLVMSALFRQAAEMKAENDLTI